MLFNSFEFIFVFLPIAFIGYFTINKINPNLGKVWLIVCSFFFYAWWNPAYLPLLLGSLLVNFFISKQIANSESKMRRKVTLTVGILFNVGLLGFFKYADFFIENINFILQQNFNFLHIILPLAISFYTFQQIAYLVDVYRNEAKDNSFINYILFISFFPQLIAGPIVQHNEVMGQYKDITKTKINWENVSKGLFIFSIGLFKKVAIADTFAVWVNNGYSDAYALNFFDSWITSLSYTFQLYFDFSGYTDMALGIALLFNIKLPTNFNSPYKALSVREYWQRWHITLSRFLSKYIYIPLGGNRISRRRTYINLILVLSISGFWHGAGWTYIMWGFLHGVAMVINRMWYKAGFKMNLILAWFVTFHFINITRVFFRSPDMATAFEVLKAMFGLKGFAVPEQISNILQWDWLKGYEYVYQISDDLWMTIYLLVGALLLTVFLKNSIQLMERLKPNPLYSIYAAALFIYAALRLDQVTEFLYFNF
ncbi:MBOAT family O-acyltransferase [Gracilibacillus xinjiangensis]|uniref:MBOAT family O-acyltransferase n=1 Tax=Gracilibacillus xinjiangensis TaxID=1193282 RepID=A0ABV8WTN1_9BACI